MSNEIELPEPAVRGVHISSGLSEIGYTADQMREAITQATEAANRRSNASWKLMCEKMIAGYKDESALHLRALREIIRVYVIDDECWDVEDRTDRYVQRAIDEAMKGAK